MDINKLIQDCEFQFRIRVNGDNWNASDKLEMGEDIFDFFMELESLIVDMLDEISEGNDDISND